jgi:transcriptional regulator with XRE-family HTH domain
MTATAAELFGKRVRAARKAAKLTQEKAAEKAHIHLNHLSQIERGTRRPSFELIFDLAQVLGVPALDFFISEPEEKDAKALRRRVTLALESCTVEQLSQVHRFINFVLRP